MRYVTTRFDWERYGRIKLARATFVIYDTSHHHTTTTNNHPVFYDF